MPSASCERRPRTQPLALPAAATFANTFPRLHARGIAPTVLYPGVLGPPDFPLTVPAPRPPTPLASFRPARALDCLAPRLRSAFRAQCILSINRFERKKRADLAIAALAELFQRAPETRTSVRLVVAGGFDPRLPECVGCATELEDLAASLDVSGQVRRGLIWEVEGGRWAVAW